MKKILSLLTLMLVCTTAWAADVFYTLDGTITGGNNAYATESDITQSGMQWKVMGNTDISPWRIGGKSLTGVDRPVYSTTPMGSAITNISLEVGAASNITVNSLTLIVASDAAFTNQIDEVTGTFVASSTIDFVPTSGTEWAANAYYKFVFNVTVSGSTNRFVEFKNAIFYAEAGAAPAVAAPVISFDKAAPYVGDNVTCTITCSTEGASIQYSTDGETYQNYSAPFTLTETTTVYAKATLGDNVSAIAENTVNFTPITEVASIAELNALTDGTVFRMTGSATVVYADATKYIYIKDGTGYTLLYNSKDAAIKGYTISNLFGKVTYYNGLFEVANAEFDYTAGDTEVEPDLINIPNITSDNVNQYVKLENVTITALNNKNFTITDADDNTLQGRDNFNLEDFPTVVTDKKFDIEGFVGKYDVDLQFYPTKFTDVTPAAQFGITVTPGAGEFTEPVTVTITATDPEAVITYTLNGGDEIDYEAPFTLNETTAVHVYATNGTDEATWNGTYTINIPVPVTLDGMIVFADRESGDNSTALTDNTFMAVVEKGADYVQGASNIEKVYAGATGLKFSSSNANGTMTLNLKNKWNATKISFIAKAWANNQGNSDVAKLTVNNQEFDLTSDFALYEIPFATAQEIQNITFAATKRAYLKVVNIEGEEVVSGPTYTITLDKQPGEYSTLINVKATVEPALPEGATLKYTIDDADPVAYDSEKGVSLLKSSVLKFTAYDAQNNALTDPVGGQYKYIVNVFGDMDGDGEVTVTDLNIVLNLILGKI